MPESVILFGATGAVGRHVLRDLLASSHFSRVVEAGRRVTPASALADVPGKEKLVQKEIAFENLEAANLKNEKADVVIIVLGTSRAAAGSAERFVLIDREYVISAAKAAKVDTVQRLVYLSSTGASATSMFLYTKSKGLTEQGLASLGYKDLVVFRPGILKGAERDEFRLTETVLGKLIDWTPVGGSSMGISVQVLAKSIVKAAQLGSASLPSVAHARVESPKQIPPYHVIGNKGAIDMAEKA